MSTTVLASERSDFDRGKDRFRFHHHPLTAAEGGVIHDMMPVGRPVAQVVDVQVERAGLLRAAHHTFA